MADANADKAIQRWLSGEISLEQLKLEIPEKDALKYAQIIGEVDQWVPEVASLALPKLPTASEQKKVVSMYQSTWMSVAASILLLCVFAFWFFNRTTEVSHLAEGGEIKMSKFPDDGSFVQLASGSRISWEPTDWDNSKRYSQFEGTGFFKVEKGGEFKVQISGGTVTVLGTSFEIDTYEDGFTVSCYTGEVIVADNGGKKRTLRAGKRVNFLNQMLTEVATFDTKKGPSWISDSTSTFENAPLLLVVGRLERQFDLQIVTSQVNTDRRFTGSFTHNDSQKALISVFTALNISFKQEGDQIFLSD